MLVEDAAAPDARRLIDAVEACGPVVTIDATTLGSLRVRTEGERVDAWLGDAPLRPAAVLAWRAPQTCAHPRLEELVANSLAWSFNLDQWSTMLRGLLLAWELGGVPIVNGADTGRWDEKTAQIVAAASVGFRTPTTLQSARVEDIGAFLQACGGSGITKAFVPYHSYDDATSRAVRQLTRVVSAREVAGRREGTIPTPALYQPLVAASTELRVVVIGDEVFAARFDRDQLGHVDARHVEAAFAPAEAHAASDELARRCRALLDRCGLDMAVIDLLIDDDGDAVFLDLNPSGIFDWIACRFDLPIYQALGRLLADLATGTPSRRSAT